MWTYRLEESGGKSGDNGYAGESAWIPDDDSECIGFCLEERFKRYGDRDE